MSRLILAAAAALAVCAAPALAQDASSPAPEAPTVEATPAPSPEEAAFEAKGQAFQADTRSMGAALKAVMDDDALDAATKKTRTDAILDQHQPRFSAFADEMATFFRALAEKPENAAQKDQMLVAAENGPAQIRGLPDQIRQGIAQALAAPTPAPTPVPAGN